MIFSIDTDLIINHGQKDEKIKGIKMHCETIGKDEVLLMFYKLFSVIMTDKLALTTHKAKSIGSEKNGKKTLPHPEPTDIDTGRTCNKGKKRKGYKCVTHDNAHKPVIAKNPGVALEQS